MRIAIVEDEKKWQHIVKREVESYKTNIKIDIFSTGEEFLEEKGSYQIVFMDIELPGKDGFAVYKEYTEQVSETVLIIISTHTELCRLGYRINAFRYIDKMYPEEIREALVSAEQALRRYKRITLKFSGMMEQEVCCKDILYFEAANHNVMVKIGQDIFECRENIGKLGRSLEEFGFCLVHRGYLVNLDHIKVVGSKGIILDNGDKLPVSRRKYSDLKIRHIQWRFENANA